MKKTIAVFAALLLFVFAACTVWETDMGSFTSGRTESHDGRYYAVQEKTGLDITVTVFSAETQAEVFSFSPARASDFHGICWESESYNIWIQSGDIGVKCYRFEDEKWLLDENAVRPADIVSKYDKH